MSIKWDYDASLKENLANLPDKMLEWALEVMLQEAHVIVGIAQINVRVDTGSLRNSIRVERGGEGMGWRQVRVRAGGYIVNPKTRRLVDYARIVEAKYPFLHPAVMQEMPTMLAMIKNKIIEEANK